MRQAVERATLLYTPLATGVDNTLPAHAQLQNFICSIFVSCSDAHLVLQETSLSGSLSDLSLAVQVHRGLFLPQLKSLDPVQLKGERQHPSASLI